MMIWPQLLCDGRLNRPGAEKPKGRSRFQQDLDRIVFSAAFRRLAHKTQVHPLAQNDHVHTRLTHSIEVASVGRSLGTIVGAHVAPKLDDPQISSDTFGYIVQAACLAHDIGNPPFGHSGEDAISEWFLDYFKGLGDGKSGLEQWQETDFLNFDGNAQGFRMLTQLENHKWNGGLQLTYAVLGAYSKYTQSSKKHPLPSSPYIGCNKIGFFHSEEDYFESVARAVGLICRDNYWCRHPLAFLVEAADDICYSVIDIEDGFRLKYLDFSAAREILAPIAGDNITLTQGMNPDEKIAKYRAVAIGELTESVAKAFLENESCLLDGTFNDDLISRTPYQAEIERACMKCH